MKVLHVITDSDRRGAQVFAFDLHRAMSDVSTLDSKVVALTQGSVGGLDVECLGPSRLDRQTLRELRRRMTQADITVAHGSSTLPACAVSGFLTGQPFVTRQISETSFWANTRSRRARVRFYLSRARHVLALARSAASDLTEQLGVSPAKISIIPNGVPQGTFAPATTITKQASLERFGLSANKTTLLSIGALVPEKGVDMAIATLQTAPDAQLLVVGDGPQRAELQELATTTAPGSVAFAGSIDDPQVAYAAADLLVVPSKGGDSMPAVIIEAGFCGVPTVSTNVGAIAETITNGETGLVVPPSDQLALDEAIRTLCSDPGRLKSMGETARKHCLDHFEIHVVAGMWIDVLASIVDS